MCEPTQQACVNLPEVEVIMQQYPSLISCHVHRHIADAQLSTCTRTNTHRLHQQAGRLTEERPRPPVGVHLRKADGCALSGSVLWGAGVRCGAVQLTRSDITDGTEHHLKGRAGAGQGQGRGR